MPRIRPEMRLVLAFTLMSLLLGEGAWALTCHCHGEGSACISENNCTGATLCYLRVIYQQDRDSYVDYGCIDDFGGLINPSLIWRSQISFLQNNDKTYVSN
uniref:Uncharacterized protein n=1 Tax=Amphimedon queenslandica TaxID=400682 RepID=A0A1X7VMF3_AMPQE